MRTSALASALASARACSLAFSLAAIVSFVSRRRHMHKPMHATITTAPAMPRPRTKRISTTKAHAGGNNGEGAGGGGGDGASSTARTTVADGRPRIVRPEPPLTLANHSLSIVDVGVDMMTLAADSASASLDMINVAFTVMLAALTSIATSSAVLNRDRRAARNPAASKEVTSPSILNVVRTTGL